MVAFVPLSLSLRKVLLSPAFLVFVVVGFSVTLKTLYVVILRRSPYPDGHDPLYVLEPSPGFLVSGLTFILVILAGYGVGYLLPGERRFRAWRGRRIVGSRPIALTRGRAAIGSLLICCVVAFVAYLTLSETQFLESPFSQKRFQPFQTGVMHRYQYLPYYFFKVAMTVASLGYAAAMLLVYSSSRSEERRTAYLLIAVFMFMLLVGHFASLRLYLLMALAQVLMLLFYYASPSRLMTGALLTLLTMGSFASITFAYRSPVPREETIARAETPSIAPPKAAQDTGHDQEEPRVTSPRTAPTATEGSVIPSSERVPPPEDASPQPAEPPPPEPKTQPVRKERREEHIARTLFSGRYFLDAAKLSHIVRHFPEKHEFFRGRLLFGGSVEVDPVHPSETGPLEVGLSRFLAREVFRERSNSVPGGFAGELYANFGWVGGLVGFVLVGSLHRVIYNHLAAGAASVFNAAVLIVIGLSTTLVLLNSGILATVSRMTIDLMVLTLVWLFVTRPRIRLTRPTPVQPDAI